MAVLIKGLYQMKTGRSKHMIKNLQQCG